MRCGGGGCSDGTRSAGTAGTVQQETRPARQLQRSQSQRDAMTERKRWVEVGLQVLLGIGGCWCYYENERSKGSELRCLGPSQYVQTNQTPASNAQARAEPSGVVGSLGDVYLGPR